MSYKSNILPGYGVEIKFDAKPPAHVLSALKANGFRWSPGAKAWSRRRIVGVADFLGWLDKAMHPGRPDGKCWECGDPNGFFRNQGAATPVYCAQCHAKHVAAEAAHAAPVADPLGVDAAYEDSCRQACGL